MKNPTRKCKNCGDVFVKKGSLQQFCMVKDECIKAFWEKINTPKEKQKVWNREKKTLKEALKTKSKYESDLQDIVNEIARLIDSNAPCVSSVRTSGKMNGGHRFSVGAWPSLRFNLYNIHKQSFADNHYKSGNPDGYDEGLLMMYGQEYYDMVHGLKLKYPRINLTIPEIKEAIITAREIRREMKLRPCNFLPQNRIDLRGWVNEKLGIYK